MLSLWEFFSWNGASAALTQSDSSLSATVGVTVGASATLTQANATLSATAAVTVGASASLTQANATLAATAAVLVTTSASLTQADATLSAAAKVTVGASATLTQADATLAATAAVTVGASASLTQADFTLSAAAAVLVAAAASLTQADFSLSADASVADATSDINLSAALTQDDFTLLADASVTGTGVRQKDSDPDYWNLPWFQVEGESFTDKLRAKALEALDEAFQIGEEASPAKAKKAARKAAKSLQTYAKAAGSLLSDDTVVALGQAAKQLNYTASQWDRSELLERVSDARLALLAYEAQQQDEEDALLALMLVA